MSAAQLEAEKKDFESQLDLVIQSLKDDPDNTELVALKTELEGMIQFINESIAELKPKQRAAPSPPPPPPQAAAAAEEQPPKWSRENHPAFKKSSSSNAASVPPPPSAEEQQDASSTSSLPVNYQVNDTVMAKWMSGDKGFYPARITSVTGSKTAPIYTVKFKSYDTVETLRAKDIRPMASSAATAAAAAPAAQKRKADSITSGAVSAGAGFGAGGAGAPPPLPPPSSSFSSSNANKNNNGIVLSATPELYPVQQSKAEDDEKPKPKFKKIKANKELEAGKNKWQEFTQKGKIGGKAKKESMFRTPEGVKGRVGFTGSGQGMRKDPTRSRHVYQPNEDLD